MCVGDTTAVSYNTGDVLAERGQRMMHYCLSFLFLLRLKQTLLTAFQTRPLGLYSGDKNELSSSVRKITAPLKYEDQAAIQSV